MAHFAKVINGIVTRVIVAEQEFVDNYDDGASGSPWIQCSYNTKKGVHLLGGTPLRKNFPSVGWLYSEEYDAFFHPRPRDNNEEYNSWILNKETFEWDPPVPFPTKQTKTIDGEEARLVTRWSESDRYFIGGLKPTEKWENVNFCYRWDHSTLEWIDI